MAGIAVRVATIDDLSVTVAVAARAFWNDPLSNFFLPDLLVQHRLAWRYFDAVVRDTFEHGELWVATADEHVVGFAAWLPPGVHEATGGLRALRQGALVMPLLARSPFRAQALRLMNEVPKHHYPEPHWYLALLGTDPKWQGHGVGSSLLAPILDRCDHDVAPAYLVTQKEANLSYYGRFAFTMVETIRVEPDTPAIWTMLREPAARNDRRE
jgi:GNAT superfamily N-acetyltransferase